MSIGTGSFARDALGSSEVPNLGSARPNRRCPISTRLASLIRTPTELYSSVHNSFKYMFFDQEYSSRAVVLSW